MKLVVALACASLALAGAARAQTSPPPSPAAPSAAAAASPSAAAPTSYGLDTPIETIAADPAGKAVLQKDMPGLLDHPMYESFKAMSLQDVAPLSNGQITDAALARTKADLALVKPSK